MELRQLEAFRAVAMYRSFSKAADALFLTQSTVSTHIKNLEQELNARLILRTTKQLSLTDDGQRFLTYVSRMLETRDAALEALAAPSECLLRLGASTIPSSYLLPQILSQYRARAPRTFFDVKQADSREIYEKLLNGSVEMGFVGADSPSPRCVSTPFCTDSLVLVTPATERYLSLGARADALSLIQNEPIIIREAGSGTQKAADRYLDKLGVDPASLHVVVRLNDLESIKRLIVAGAGISICSRFAMRDVEKSGRVRVIPLPCDTQRSFYAAYLKGKLLSSEAAAFLRFAQSFYTQADGI